MIEGRERLLGHLRGEEERAVGARVCDLIEIALRDEKPVGTDFLDPFQQQVAAGILESVPEVSYRSYGGYPAAERRRLLIFPHYYLVELLEDPVTAIDVTVKSAFDEASHRDCLGALLGTGIAREKIGDVIVTARGCQAVVARESAEYIVGALRRVGRAPAEAREIDPEQLEVEPERVREIRTTVASLRLDAVASAGFGASRTKMAREIKAERVKVNWKPVRDPAHPVAQGDVLSIRGRGRVVVEEVQDTTRKGRINVLLKRMS